MYDLTFDNRSYVYQERDIANQIYFIQEGEVKVTKLNEQGKEYIIYLFQPGDLFGQFELDPDATHNFSAQAIGDCKLGAIQLRDLEILLWQEPDLAIEFMHWMSLMNRITQTKLRDLIMYGKTGALCSTLIRLANSYGVEIENGIFISFKLTNSLLAEFIGSARESVNRMLSDLRKAGAIEVQSGYIIIKNLLYLQDICKCEQCPKHVCRI